jgi:hypothetical protein
MIAESQMLSFDGFSTMQEIDNTSNSQLGAWKCSTPAHTQYTSGKKNIQRVAGKASTY